MTTARWLKTSDARQYCGRMGERKFEQVVVGSGEVTPIRLGNTDYYDRLELDAFFERRKLRNEAKILDMKRRIG